MVAATESLLSSARLPLFVCFLAFIATFVVTRTITRMIRSGRGPFRNNVSASGLHIHHVVPGVLVLVAGAFLAVGAHGASPWAEIAGAAVGIGTALVLDEFALILRLDDVYWSEEGRVSVEMVALGVAVLGLVLLGSNPFEMQTGAGRSALVASVIGILVHLGLVVVCVMKGKYPTALLGTLVPLVSIVAAIRLARPDSRWARRRYDDPKRDAARRRAQTFDTRYGQRLRRLSDLVAGTLVVPPPPRGGDQAPQ